MTVGQNYRTDIDGLRAVAVLAVVLFHFGVPGFSGGYLGVDVFFVISGFLISRIIVAAVAEGRFSFVQFYERRVRRIVPALAAVLLASTVAASILLTPTDLVLFCRSLIATLFFASNLYFHRALGYFGPGAESAPLLHTWSLSIEEQFYLVYPLFLVFLLRRRPSSATRAVIAVLLLSFALHLLAAYYAPRWGFYVTPMRFWQLMLGALLALGALPQIGRRAWREGLALAGLAAVLWSLHAFDAPGFLVAVPTAGAALLIYANGNGRTRVGAVLSWRPLVFIGLISYSLYLWHWPIRVFARYVLMRPLSEAEIPALIGLSFVAAVLSWRYIEQPFRGARGCLARPRLFRYAGSAAALLLTASITGLAMQGWPQRLDSQQYRLASYLTVGRTAVARDEMRYGTCYLNAIRMRPQFWEKCGAKAGGTNLLLWGDSHAAHFYPGLRGMAEQTGYHIAQANRSGCPPMANDPERECARFNASVRANIAGFDAVILSARWRLDRDLLPGLQEMAAELSGQGVPVIVLGPSVEYHADVPRILARHMRRGQIAPFDAKPYEVQEVRPLDDEMRTVFSKGAGVTYISVREALCPDERCPLMVDGVPAHFDYGHLMPQASHLVARRIWPAILAALMPVANDRPENESARE